MKYNKLISVLLLLAALPANAKIVLPSIISDNAVIQQNTNVRLWGKDTPGAKVTAWPSWSDKSVTTVTDKKGRWEMTVATPAASMTPLEIRFTDSEGDSKTISNLLSGEVWLASGQSNMEMPLRGFWTQPVEGAAEAIAYSGNNPQIRFATVPKRASYTPQDDVETRWVVSNPQNAADFSALAYFFAESLSGILNVPVGIISCAYGGSKVEGWMPKEKLDTYPNWSVEKEQLDSKLQEYERINVMYNAMLNPVKGYTVKGFLWNQGESNVGKHDEYHNHLADMVEIWREDWKDDKLPFYFVEIPGWHYNNPDGIDAALFRESQQKAQKLIPNSAIISAIDLVYPYELEDIHASKKKEIGERLAFTAAARAYGISGIPHEFPQFKKMTVEGDKAILDFSGAESGFTPNDTLEGFEAAGNDGKFYPAKATEDWNTRQIIVTCDKIDRIKAVRYCFHNFAIGKVKNLMGFPLLPFRTDKD